MTPFRITLHVPAVVAMLLVAGLFVGLASGSQRVDIVADERPLTPRAVIFGNADRTGVRIAPDGRRIGWLAPRNGVMNVWVQELAPIDDPRGAPEGATRSTDGVARTGDPRIGLPWPVTHATRRPIRQWEFLPGEGGVTREIVYLQDEGGDEDFRLYAVEIGVPPYPGGEPATTERCLTPWEGTRTKLLAVDQRHPEQILVANNRRDRTKFDVLRLNARTGTSELVFRNDFAWFDMLHDGDWRIRVVRRFLSDGSAEARCTETPDGPLVPFRMWSPDDAGPSKPLAVSADGKSVFLIDSSREISPDTGALFEVSIAPPERQRWRAIAHHARSEPRTLLTDPATGKPMAISFETARVEWTPIDASFASDLAVLRSIGDGNIEIPSRSADNARWIVTHIHAEESVTHWLYDRPSGRITKLFNASDALEAIDLLPMHAETVRARDGLELLCYLTLPRGFVRGSSRPVPMVLHVHGGPWTRDVWGVHPMHQWLGDRGYAVLSVNFRGSTGFGKAFVNAGNRQWSKAMHTDLLDAVEWAVGEGIADRSRVAIMGQSYGGYATLVGLTFTPEVFACGVDIVGPANLQTLLRTIPEYWEAERGNIDRRVGRVDEDEWLASISPINRVDRIVRPLLIGQGANDPRVPRDESDQIVRAARSRGIPVTYVVFPDEGHGFARPENRMAFMAITEAFLARHLGGRCEPIGEVLGRSSAQIEAGADAIESLRAPR